MLDNIQVMQNYPPGSEYFKTQGLLANEGLSSDFPKLFGLYQMFEKTRINAGSGMDSWTIKYDLSPEDQQFFHGKTIREAILSEEVTLERLLTMKDFGYETMAVARHRIESEAMANSITGPDQKPVLPEGYRPRQWLQVMYAMGDQIYGLVAARAYERDGKGGLEKVSSLAIEKHVDRWRDAIKTEYIVPSIKGVYDAALEKYKKEELHLDAVPEEAPELPIRIETMNIPPLDEDNQI